jgi:putative transposase
LKASRDIKPLLVVAKRSRKYSWLKDFDSIALQEACRNLDTAFANFFNPNHPARFPRFKSRRGKQSSYHCTGQTRVGVNSITLPKIGQIAAVIHREIIGELKSITVSRTPTGEYYAAILTEDEAAMPTLVSEITEDQILGIDVGLSHLIIQDNGRKVASPCFLSRAQENLRRKQKALSRKKRGGANREKARQQVARCHEKVARCRHDHQHKLSKQLIDENQAIVVETLSIKRMQQDKRLAKAIADASWHALVEKLAYKAECAGKHLVKVDTFYPSSKRCSCCGHVRSHLSLAERTWTCTVCGARHDRDVNAAKNLKHQGILELKAAGLVVSAPGGLCKTRVQRATACEVGSSVLAQA